MGLTGETVAAFVSGVTAGPGSAPKRASEAPSSMRAAVETCLRDLIRERGDSRVVAYDGNVVMRTASNVSDGLPREGSDRVARRLSEGQFAGRARAIILAPARHAQYVALLFDMFELVPRSRKGAVSDLEVGRGGVRIESDEIADPLNAMSRARILAAISDEPRRILVYRYLTVVAVRAFCELAGERTLFVAGTHAGPRDFAHLETEFGVPEALRTAAYEPGMVLTLQTRDNSPTAVGVAPRSMWYRMGEVDGAVFHVAHELSRLPGAESIFAFTHDSDCLAIAIARFRNAQTAPPPGALFMRYGDNGSNMLDLGGLLARVRARGFAGERALDALFLLALDKTDYVSRKLMRGTTMRHWLPAYMVLAAREPPGTSLMVEDRGGRWALRLANVQRLRAMVSKQGIPDHWAETLCEILWQVVYWIEMFDPERLQALLRVPRYTGAAALAHVGDAI